MNYICPLCNTLKQFIVNCERCRQWMVDCGKMVDYFDDYSAYEDIVTLKKVDGVDDSLKKHTCLHLFQCSACFFEKTVEVQEIRFS